MSKELLEKAVSQKHLTPDTVKAQFCSDWLKDEVSLLFNQLEALRSENGELRAQLEIVVRVLKELGQPPYRTPPVFIIQEAIEEIKRVVSIPDPKEKE